MPSPLSGRIRVHIWDFGATVATEFDRIGVPVQCLYESIWLTYLLTLCYWNVDVVYRYCHIMALGMVISWSTSCISALSNHPSRTWSGYFPNLCVIARERSRDWRRLSGLWARRVEGAVTLEFFSRVASPCTAFHAADSQSQFLSRFRLVTHRSVCLHSSVLERWT